MSDQTKMTNEEIEKNFPSLDDTYPIAIQSYEIMRDRIEEVDKKNQQITAFGVVLLFARACKADCSIEEKVK